MSVGRPECGGGFPANSCWTGVSRSPALRHRFLFTVGEGSKERGREREEEGRVLTLELRTPLSLLLPRTLPFLPSMAKGARQQYSRTTWLTAVSSASQLSSPWTQNSVEGGEERKAAPVSASMGSKAPSVPRAVPLTDDQSLLCPSSGSLTIPLLLNEQGKESSEREREGGKGGNP